MRITSTVTIAAVVMMATSLAVFSGEKQIIQSGPSLGYPFSPAVKAGGLIYVSGALAVDEQGKVIAGDVKFQTRRILDQISQLLGKAGTGLQNAASVSVYLKNIADFPAMNEVYQTYWPNDPPARTTIACNLVLPDALVEISMVVISAGGERKIVHPASWLKSPLPYSYGILSGDTLFLAGLVSRNGKDNQPVAGDMKVQVKTVMENAGEILRAAGMNYSDVVSSRVFITDVAQFQDMNSAYRAFFPKDPPARATVRSGLVAPQYLVEITMVASRGQERRAFTTPNADGSPGQTNPNLSSAIRVGSRLYVSGMLGNTPSNQGDVRGQTRETLSRIGRTLKSAGFDWKDVVEGLVYLTDIGNFAGMNDAYREVFAKEFPARATIGTGLVAPDGLVEIMFTAVR